MAAMSTVIGFAHTAVLQMKIGTAQMMTKENLHVFRSRHDAINGSIFRVGLGH